MSYKQTASGWIRDVSPAPGSYHEAEQPGLPRAWWRANRRYGIYMLRELSSVFVALWSLRFLRQLGRVRKGAASYDAYIAAQRQPWRVALSVVALAFALLHSITFLQLAGTVQTVRIGARKLPERQVTAGAFAGWAVASVTVLLALLLGGRKGEEN